MAKADSSRSSQKSSSVPSSEPPSSKVDPQFLDYFFDALGEHVRTFYVTGVVTPTSDMHLLHEVQIRVGSGSGYGCCEGRFDTLVVVACFVKDREFQLADLARSAKRRYIIQTTSKIARVRMVTFADAEVTLLLQFDEASGDVMKGRKLVRLQFYRANGVSQRACAKAIGFQGLAVDGEGEIAVSDASSVDGEADES